MRRTEKLAFAVLSGALVLILALIAAMLIAMQKPQPVSNSTVFVSLKNPHCFSAGAAFDSGGIL